MAQSKTDTAARKPVGQSVSATRRVSRLRRHARLRKKISGTPQRPRLVVHRSARHIHVQLVNDVTGTTLAAAKRLGRRYLGVESSPDYAERIRRRLEGVTPELNLPAEETG